MIDRKPRYAPTQTIVAARRVPVTSWRAHPPGTHPKGCPLIPNCTALELVTPLGSRWWGVEKAWINSELRMVVSGFPERCEIRRSWPEAKKH